MPETWVQSLGGEDPLEEEMETHSSILAGKIPFTKEPDGLQSMGWQKSWTQLNDWAHKHGLRQVSFRKGCTWTHKAHQFGYFYIRFQQMRHFLCKQLLNYWTIEHSSAILLLFSVECIIKALFCSSAFKTCNHHCCILFEYVL